ncbi:helix-turn-helix transcriptional regulator [bacterium]|nr:helix-turn-helix transcriptional regulator [bacterium]
MNTMHKPGRLTPRQYAFYAKVIELIDGNLVNPNLSVSWLSGKTDLSRSQLFRRIQAMTGQSVSRLITERRIASAIQLLNEAPMTIEEIAKKVGFHSAPYFSRCFKDQRGMTPSDYLRSQF